MTTPNNGGAAKGAAAGGVVLFGLRLIENPALVKREEYQVPRTWRERLLSRPWRPWRGTNTFTREVVDSGIYRTPDALIAHPQTVARIRAALSNIEGGKA